MLYCKKIVLLILFGICFKQAILMDYSLPDEANNDNNTLISYICDDALLKSMDSRLEKQSLVNEILTTKLNLIHTELQQHLKELQNCPNYTLPASCAEAVRSTGQSGIHQIQLRTTHQSQMQQPFFVYCEKNTSPDGDAWTIIQRRQNADIDFYRNWSDYKYGFGSLNSNFFIGLEQLHALTQSSLHELWVQLEDFENEKRFAKYDAFAIGNEVQSYALNILGSFSGNAGDALGSHRGHKFSTSDVDNDVHANNCAKMFFGGWWYHKCHSSNLNGLYLGGVYPKEKYAQGVDWSTWRGQYYSLKYVHMAIRSVKKS